MPTRIRPGGLSVATAEVSDIPHSSAISIPIASKNSITSGGVGAAPTANHSHLVESEHWRGSSRTTARPRLAHSPLQLGGHLARPAWRAPARSPISSAPAIACLRASSRSAAKPASSAAFSFSQIRGTPPQTVGLTSIE